MENGLSFVDDSQMSVREKIDKYFLKKKTAIPVVVLDESTSDESFVNSFSNLDESFAEIFNNNPHVTLIRKKGSASQLEPENEQLEQQKIEPQTTEEEEEEEAKHQMSYEEKFEETFHQQLPQKLQKSPYMPTPTRRGQVRLPTIRSDDSLEMDPNDLWFVSDESFLEMESACESPRVNENDSDFDDFDASVFEHRPSSHLMLSPMKQVALRRPSTILEESTNQSVGSGEGSSLRSSLSLKQSICGADESSKASSSRSYRPSLVNVFPTRGRIGFYDSFDLPSSTSIAKTSVRHNHEKENSVNLMTFEDVNQDSLPSEQTMNRQANHNNSIYLIELDGSQEASHHHLSVDQTQHDSSMSDSEPPDQFNDTLEAVDFYMKQGNKILNRTTASTTLHHQQPSVMVSSPKTRNNSLLKQTLERRYLLSKNGDTKLVNKNLF